jgi:hypothetical protein
MITLFMGRGNSGGIATCYGLGSNPGGGEISAPVQTGPGSHPASHTMGTGSSPGVKLPEHSVYHSPLSSAEVKDRVELYLYSHLGP